MRKTRFNIHLAAALMGAVALSATAVEANSITSQLQFDINSITIQARDTADTMNVAFNGITFTGSLVFGKDTNSTISMYVDGVHQSSFTAGLNGFTGKISLLNGTIASGTMEVSVLNADTTIDKYTYAVIPGSGSVSRPVSTIAFRLLGYQLNGDTNNGYFNDANFGGLGVSFWHDREPLLGSFLQFKYKPNSTGFDSNSDVDLFTTATATPIPLPAAFLAGSALLGGLSLRRRRA